MCIPIPHHLTAHRVTPTGGSVLFQGHVPRATGTRPSAGGSQVRPVLPGDWPGLAGGVGRGRTEAGHGEPPPCAVTPAIKSPAGGMALKGTEC